MSGSIDRRRYLKLAGIAVATTAVAGCSTGGSSSDGGSDDGADGGDGGDGSGGSSDNGSSGGEWTQTSTVDMNDELTFAPQKIQVEAGTEVTWETVGSIGHSVTAYEDEIPDGATYFASGGFDSEQAASDGYNDGEGNITEGESYSHTFETTGTYEYYCIPHEMNGMVGQVKVV